MGEDFRGRKHFATPEATRARLEAAGFVEVETWLHEEPTPVPDDDLEPYLETICLGDHVEGMGRERAARRSCTRWRRGCPSRVIDYVRLNIRARRR